MRHALVMMETLETQAKTKEVVPRSERSMVSSETTSLTLIADDSELYVFYITSSYDYILQ